jgi:hypothetical protein
MLFDRLDERNTMVKSVPYFDNFTKWTFLSVNKKQIIETKVLATQTEIQAGRDTEKANRKVRI